VPQVHAQAANRIGPGVNGRQRGNRRGQGLALLQQLSFGRNEMRHMPVFVHIDQEVAELASVVATKLHLRADLEKLGVVVTHEGGGRQQVHFAGTHLVVPEVVDVTRKKGFNAL
jgi:hypothetical protein